jgi:hypothetical protein
MFTEEEAEEVEEEKVERGRRGKQKRRRKRRRGSGGGEGSGGRSEGKSIDRKSFLFRHPFTANITRPTAVERRISLKRCYKAVGSRWRHRCRESSGCTRDGNPSTMR